MELKHTSSLEFAEIDLLKIYNTVPRTLSRSAIAASVILDNRGRDDRVALNQENSGNYWIFKIDNTKGWLLPKGGQRIDRYQYQTLESLFECNGYQPEGTRKFTIQVLAKVSFDFDKDKWFLQDKGILKFGNNSTFFELEAAQQECETLTLELEQSRQENKELQEKLEISKVNVQQLKRQLDLSLELQEAKNYQADISKKLESFRQELLKKISDRDSQNSNIDIETFKQEIIKEISDRIPQQSNIDLEYLKKLIREEIGERTSQKPSINVQFLKQKILNEISDRDIKFDNKLKSLKEKLLGEISDRDSQQLNIDLASLKQEIIEEIGDHPKQQSVKLISKNSLKSNKTTVKSTDISILSIPQILEIYHSNPNILAEIAIPVNISHDKEDQRGNSIAVNDSKGCCWIIKTNYLFLLIPGKDYRFNSYRFTILTKFFTFKEYSINRTKKFILEEPAIVIPNGQDWILKQKGTLNFASDAQDYSLIESQKKDKLFTQQTENIYKANNLESLIKIYNSNPRKLGNDIARVVATGESLEKRRSGISTPIIFVESSQYIYFILQELPLENDCFYLVPKDNLIINSSIYQSIKEIFICQNYSQRNSNKFILKLPAIVKFTRDWENEWELVESGEIIFS